MDLPGEKDEECASDASSAWSVVSDQDTEDEAEGDAAAVAPPKQGEEEADRGDAPEQEKAGVPEKLPHGSQVVWKTFFSQRPTTRSPTT